MSSVDESSEELGRRQATINRDGGGDPLGIAVFLTAADLRALGVNPENTEAVEIQVHDGDLRVTPTTGAQDDRASRASTSP